MKEALTSIEAHQRILRNFNLGYTLWFSFVTDQGKVAAKDAEWTAQYGTRLQSYQRQDRKQRGHPTAVATSLRVLGSPHSRELILMATPLALSAHPASPWTKQPWQQRPPECGAYFMVREPRPRSDYAWTWRLREQEFNKLSARLTALVKSGDAGALTSELGVWMRIFVMHGGVRRQFMKLLTSAQKLWRVCHASPWPGIEPGALPFVTKFQQS